MDVPPQLHEQGVMPGLWHVHVVSCRPRGRHSPWGDRAAEGHYPQVKHSASLQARRIIVGWEDSVGVLPPQIDPEAMHLHATGPPHDNSGN